MHVIFHTLFIIDVMPSALHFTVPNTVVFSCVRHFCVHSCMHTGQKIIHTNELHAHAFDHLCAQCVCVYACLCVCALIVHYQVACKTESLYIYIYIYIYILYAHTHTHTHTHGFITNTHTNTHTHTHTQRGRIFL
jgi:hypothetical protein